MSASQKPEFQTYFGIRPSEEMLAKIHMVIEEYCSKELEPIVRKMVQKDLKRIVRNCLKENSAFYSKATPPCRVAQIKEIPVEEAKPLIAKFLRKHFKKKELVYPSDVADDLGLDYRLVARVFHMLEKEGKLLKKGE